MNLLKITGDLGLSNILLIRNRPLIKLQFKIMKNNKIITELFLLFMFIDHTIFHPLIHKT
jgi:hypothetical protein